MTTEDLFNALAGIIKPVTDNAGKTKTAPKKKRK